MRKQRNLLTPEEISSWSNDVIYHFFRNEFQNHHSYFIYVSDGSEVYTRGLIKKFLQEGKTITVPKICADEMRPVHLRSFDELRRGMYGLLEPRSDRAYEGEIDVCVAPGLAFTKGGIRLGSGKGYYDRYIDQNMKSGMVTMGFAFDFQLREEVPCESHDRLVEIVLTDKRGFKNYGRPLYDHSHRELVKK